MSEVRDDRRKVGAAETQTFELARFLYEEARILELDPGDQALGLSLSTDDVCYRVPA